MFLVFISSFRCRWVRHIFSLVSQSVLLWFWSHEMIQIDFYDYCKKKSVVTRTYTHTLICPLARYEINIFYTSLSPIFLWIIINFAVYLLHFIIQILRCIFLSHSLYVFRSSNQQIKTLMAFHRRLVAFHRQMLYIECDLQYSISLRPNQTKIIIDDTEHILPHDMEQSMCHLAYQSKIHELYLCVFVSLALSDFRLSWTLQHFRLSDVRHRSIMKCHGSPYFWVICEYLDWNRNAENAHRPYSMM